MNKTVTAFCLVFIISGSILHADTITLKNGSQDCGEIMREEANAFLIRDKTGRTMWRKKIDISEIRQGPCKKNMDSSYSNFFRKPDLTLQDLKPGFLKTEKKAAAPVDFSNRTVAGSTWRSALIPGWGQYYQGKQVRGGVYFLSTLAVGAVLVDSWRAYRDARNSYDQSITTSWVYPTLGLAAGTTDAVISYMQSSLLQDKVNQRSRQYTNAAAAMLGVYLINLVDAVFFSGNTSPAKKSLPGMPAGIFQRRASVNVAPEFVSDSGKTGTRMDFLYRLRF